MMARMTLAIGLVLAGAGGMYLYMAPSTGRPDSPASPPAVAEMPAEGQSLVLTTESMDRTGIVVAPAVASTAAIPLRVPGIVEPDGYRTVEVTPIVSGTVVSMSAMLGDVVEPGAPVARLRSPEMTDEARRWLTGRAALDAVVSRFERTTQLAKIGAASREEVEAVEAERVRLSTEVDTARARLVRLGLTDADLIALTAGRAAPELIAVPAPVGGVVLRRTANPGQNVGETDSLITLADVRHVWVMADVFERDLARMRIGQRVSVTSEAYAGRAWTGRVAYIDPELARDTRTARVRVEVDNPDAALRFGMFVIVTVLTPSEPHVRVPKVAVQTLGAASVVYVEAPDSRYTFSERSVLTGDIIGDEIEIRAGVAEGDRVVGEGSFFLRAERDRLGWPQPAALDSVPVGQQAGRGEAATAAVAERVVEITATGMNPERVTVPAYQPVDLVFIRRVEETCGTEVLIPALSIRRPLPLNERVTVRLPARAPGELTFSCGMEMLQGVIVVTPRLD